MPVDRQQAAAYIAATHVVFGLRLAPMGARHWLALDFLDSPFITGGAGEAGSAADPGALLVAAEVLHCESAAQLNAYLTGTQIDDPERSGRLTEFALSGEEEQAAQFRELDTYLDTYWSVPLLMDTAPAAPAAPAQHASAHPAIVLATRAMIHLGLSREAAWWAPLAELRWELHCRDEFEGGREIPVYTERRLAELVADGHLTAAQAREILR